MIIKVENTGAILSNTYTHIQYRFLIVQFPCAFSMLSLKGLVKTNCLPSKRDNSLI